ncbi:MAG: hypothetical protein VX938_10725, partial [Myxococcota bacterium]|nr:hypothetical protein [Myxococcota bacterium]
AERPSAWSGAFDLPLHRSNTGLALVLLLALLALLVDLPGMWRDMGCDRPGCARVTGALLALVAAGAALRWLAGPTFLQEAHPLMHIPVGDYVRLLGEPHEPYPQGPQLMFLALRWLLPENPYDAWLTLDVLLGTLTFPAAYLLGTALGQRRAWGLMAAALLAFWPQHIRLSASESVHVAVIFWATLSLATTVIAARSGSVTAAVSAVLTTGALLCTRPEAALWVPGLAVIGLGAGPGIRGALKHPAVIVAVGVVIWLLGPMLLELVGTSQAGRLTPGSAAPEAVTLGSLGEALVVFFRPDGPNALFDARTTPVWLWPMALWGAVVAWRQGNRALVLGLLLTVLAILTVTVRMGASGVYWPMARYHGTAL